MPLRPGAPPRAVTRGALHTHPCTPPSASRLPSDAYAGGHVAAFAERCPSPTDAVLRGIYGPDDIPATRRTVAQWARRCGLPEEQVEVLELAASELATNSVRHGGGTGTLAMWLDRRGAVVEFTDSGTIADPLTGRLRPPLDSVGGRGCLPGQPAVRPGAGAVVGARDDGPRHHLALKAALPTWSSPASTNCAAMSRTFVFVSIETRVSAWNASSGVSLRRSIRMPLAWSITDRDANAASRFLARSSALS